MWKNTGFTSSNWREFCPADDFQPHGKPRRFSRVPDFPNPTDMKTDIFHLRTLRRLMLAISLVIAKSPALAGNEQPAKRPNFVFILADDLGYSDTAVQMHPDHKESRRDYFETPNIDRLARAGMRFSDGYAPAPICTPSRRSIQFGMTPARQRGTVFESDFVPGPHLSIPQMLKQVDPDYRCAHFGKWGEVITGRYANDWSELPAHPAILGYDRNDGITGNYNGWSYHTKHDPANAHRNMITEAWEDPKLTFSTTEKAVDFIRRQAAEKHPFYLQVSYYAVHDAIQARQKTIDKYKAKGEPPARTPPGVAAMADDMDEAIGTILDTIDELGLADSTYVIFSSDNGGYADGWGEADRASTQRNSPLRSVKGLMHEGGIRVPFLVRGPGVKAGAVCREPVAGYDLWPTLRELAGGTGPLPAEIDGGSLAGVLHGGGVGGVKRADPFLVFHMPTNAVQSALRQGDFKLFVDWKTSRLELYNLADDIGEQNNLAAKMPQKTAELYQLLASYLESVNAEEPRALRAAAKPQP